MRVCRSLQRLSLLGFVALLSCASGGQLRGQIEGLKQITVQAERNGAVRCAPRELAIAKSQLEFAELELAQGFISKSEAHLWKAEANAHAAQFLSPPQYCAERIFIESKLPQKGDKDGDGYSDPDDKCPEQPENFNGFEDQDGCPDDPDTDGDGIADSVDACQLDPEDRDQYLDDDGCPELDNDSDTLADAQDKCPSEPEDFDGYQDADGCPDPDNDKDTVLDVEDQCPNEIGLATAEPKGCPTKPALAIITDCEVKITEQLHFAYNKAVIRPGSYAVLDAVTDILRRNPDVKLEIQGHTDNQGGDAYNKRLSNQRAASVVKYLTSRGILAERLTSKGYGFDRPLLPNDSPANMAINRRVQFVRTEGVKDGCPKTGG